MNLPYVFTYPATCIERGILPPSPEVARRSLTAHATEHGAALAALLDACHGPAAGNRARALADLAAQTAPDPAAVCATAARLREDLLDILAAPVVLAPDKLGCIALDTLDAAVRFHGARLDELLTALCPQHVGER